MALGQQQAVWPLLRHSPDPTLRTHVTHGISPIVTDAETLLARLDREDDVTVRRAIVLMAGQLVDRPLEGTGRLAAMSRKTLPQPCVEKLLDLYRDDPDPGMHAAAEWTLRQAGTEAEAEIARLDRQIASSGIRGECGWYLNRQGHTMVVIPGPAQFLMGSPGPAARSDERQHSRRIRHSFSIAAKETTVEQFGRFLAENLAANSVRATMNGLPPDRPQTSVSWYETAAYCNWLSKVEEVPSDQWCYVPNAEGRYAAGMRPAHDWLDLRGYRLPTEAEWEYACRAGATTDRYFGSDPSYLRYYGAFDALSSGQPLAVGRLQPNDFGLFDMLGNAAEWCHDCYRADPDSEAAANRDQNAAVMERDERVVRGGAFSDTAERLRSAARDKDRPLERRATIGFRIARGYP